MSFLDRIKKAFWFAIHPSEKEIASYADSISEEYAREILGTSHMTGDGTDPRLVRRAAGYVLAKADITGDAFKLRILTKYRGKSPEEVYGLLTEEEVDQLLSCAESAKLEGAPSDPKLRRDLAILVFGLFRITPMFSA